jgi:hypothetical protein
MSQVFDFDPETIPVHFIDGVIKLSAMRERIRHEINQLGDPNGVSLIIPDTNSAFFEGKEENDNIQARDQALMLRTFTTMPGLPAVVTACHPRKNAAEDDLIPRGGGAFLNELDGNLTSRRVAHTGCELGAQGKFRGSEFSPIGFLLKSGVTHPLLVDTKGRQLKTVVAHYLSDQAQDELERAARSDQDNLLVALYDAPEASHPELARRLKWFMSNGVDPHKVKVGRVLQELKNTKPALITLDRGKASLTSAGLAKVEQLTGRKTSRPAKGGAAPRDIDLDDTLDGPGDPVRFLERELQGGPKVADEVFAAAKIRGFTQSQLMAAKNELKVRAYGEGTPSVWMWSLKDKT